jgi:hypothetical protein
MREKFLRRASAVSVAVVCVAALAACGIGTKVLDGKEVEKQIADGLVAQGKPQPKSIACPKELEAKKDKTYECTLTAPNGDQLPIAIKMTNDDGKYAWEVKAAK